jgi:membrane associated rhomboid family serine protease
MTSPAKIIIVVTVLLSLLSFRNGKLLNALLLWPAKMKSPKTYYRFLTAGFVHADYTHLFVNMFSFFFFSGVLEHAVSVGPEWFTVLYLTGVIVACVPSYLKNRKNELYQSLGASGGVAAIIFATIYLNPWKNVIAFGSYGLPSIVFAFIYLFYTAYLARKGKGKVNHDAHLWGALYGFIFMLLLDPSHGINLLHQLMHPVFKN